MPRGNLETIAPRGLVLSAARSLLNQQQYKDVSRAVDAVNKSHLYFYVYILCVISVSIPNLLQIHCYNIFLLYVLSTHI